MINTVQKPAKAISFAITSTDGSLTSLRHQVSATRDYCNTRNLKIVKEFEFDDAILIKKPTLKKIVKFIESSCKNSDSKVVLVSHSIDTFKGYFEEFTLLKGFVKQGLLEIHFIREKLALDYIYILKCDTFSDISMIIQNARSYYNSNFIKAKLQEKLKNGEIIGVAPIGYTHKPRTDRNQKAEIVINEKDSLLVRNAFELYSTGQYSIVQIEDFLTHNELRDKAGNILCDTQVRKMLKNPFYCGYMKVNGKLYPHKYGNIIDVELFNKCQTIIKGGKVVQQF